MRARGQVLFLAWTKTSGRAVDIAAELDGVSALVHPPVPLLRHPASTAVRYVVSALQTLVLLVRLNPRAVVVTNPPLVPPLIVWFWSALTRRIFVLDSHPAGFGLKGHRGIARLQPFHRLLARAAAGVLVTTDELAGQVDDWGGHGVVVHEAPVSFPPPVESSPPTVLFVGIFASDEPVAAVVDAARELPDVHFELTGDPRRAPRSLVEHLPKNVTLLGFLDQDTYRATVAACSLVLTLTTEPRSVMRSAYEAVYAGRPLVTTDTATLRQAFPFAVFCHNETSSIVEAVRHALEDLPGLCDKAEAARDLQVDRWSGQLAALRTALLL